MPKRFVSIALKIPDNTAYTALVALRRLGIGVERVERGEVYAFDDVEDVGALAARVAADEAIFNPNKHVLTVLESGDPRPGEVWIEPLQGAERVGRKSAVAWRLFDARGEAMQRSELEAAAERLLCNPAIERARL